MLKFYAFIIHACTFHAPMDHVNEMTTSPWLLVFRNGSFISIIPTFYTESHVSQNLEMHIINVKPPCSHALNNDIINVDDHVLTFSKLIISLSSKVMVLRHLLFRYMASGLYLCFSNRNAPKDDVQSRHVHFVIVFLQCGSPHFITPVHVCIP